MFTLYTSFFSVIDLLLWYKLSILQVRFKLVTLQCFGRCVELEPDLGHIKYLYLGQILNGSQAVQCYNKAIEVMLNCIEAQVFISLKLYPCVYFWSLCHCESLWWFGFLDQAKNLFSIVRKEQVWLDALASITNSLYRESNYWSCVH